MKFLKYISLLLIIGNLTLSANELGLNKNKVLSGLILRHGDIVDSIRPIYGAIDKSGKIEDLSFGGPQVGGNGGSEKIILKNGYVISGFYLDKGDYFGASHIAKLRIVWQKWIRHKPEGDLVLSTTYSSGKNLENVVKMELIAPAGSFIYELNAKATAHTNGDNFLSEIQITTINEKLGIKTLSTGSTFIPSISYNLEVEIVSGFNKGKIAKGIFSYNPLGILGDGEEYVEVSEIEFTYDKDTYTKDMFDSVPKVRLVDGIFKEIQFVGGPQSKRFGLNAGFDRFQFNRENEKFISKGEEYFGYLNADTYVEGAGKVKYKKLESK
ncbi:MAG: hypothetical protein IPL26_25635 [Leptospiraceae bacterium]|nr:hypothetical protein [Leptospiraceae bacterium]